MNKILFLSLWVAVCASCEKIPSNGPKTDDPKAGFTWSTLTSKTITLTDPSNILNERGDTVAVNLQPGTYSIPTGMHTRLDSHSAPTSKAAEAESKVFFPASGQYATMLVEDNFPYKGDYDMNDLVIGFRIEYILDPTVGPDRFSTVRTIKVTILPRALGSSYELLGLGLAFNGELPTLIKSVTGNHTGNLSKLFAVDKNNVETGSITGSPVVPLSGDLRSDFMTYQKTGMVNTFEKLAHNPGKPFSVTIELDKGIDLNSLELFGKGVDWNANMDLFVIVENRSKEIHMKGQRPTFKFNKNLLSSLKDFVTADNYVWMTVVDKEIPYPTEGTGIENAYPKFTDWVNQNGNLPYNWYDNYEPAYVYKKK